MLAKVTPCLFSSLLFACTVGDATDPGPDPLPDPDPNGSLEVSGTISENAAWGGEVTMTAETIIEAGVTVRIAKGTVFEAAQNAVLRVHGTLAIEGTTDDLVSLTPVEGAGGWGGIVVESGGSASVTNVTGTKVATLLYCKAGASQCAIEGADLQELGKVIQAESIATITMSNFRDLSNGGVTVTGNGDLTITDTYIWTSTHDLVVQSGGSLTIDHSEVGGANQSYEHCDVHIGSAQSLSITNSNIVSAIYGMMLGGTTNAVIQYNNFMSNDPDQDVSPIGANTGVDLRFNYWDKGAPDLGAEYDTSSPAAQAIAEAGPRWALP